MVKRPLRPNLAEVHCERLKFEAGDRILVNVYTNLDKDQKRRLRRAITKWAGEDVEILIVNRLEMEVTIIKDNLEALFINHD